MATLIPFLTVSDIASKLGVSRQRVHAIAKSRQILPVRCVGATRVFASSDMRRFREKKKSGRPKKVLTGVSKQA